MFPAADSTFFLQIFPQAHSNVPSSEEKSTDVFRVLFGARP